MGETEAPEESVWDSPTYKVGLVLKVLGSLGLVPLLFVSLVDHFVAWGMDPKCMGPNDLVHCDSTMWSRAGLIGLCLDVVFVAVGLYGTWKRPRQGWFLLIAYALIVAEIFAFAFLSDTPRSSWARFGF